MKNAAGLTAVLLLIGGLAAGCGGSDDDTGGDKAQAKQAAMPQDAATEDFCSAMLDLSGGAAADKEAFRAAREKLKKTGTPKEIVGDAREGFVVFVAALDAVEDPVKAEDPGFTKDEQAKLDKLSTEFVKICQEAK
ncbi:hypothetical protein [Nocardioides daejeonensis]|uniref:hypothetical protein n=1 Tax=Nocardioides daejeonensis TaxID=1046556 RepID=UPI000D742DEB|nr:hypothetical protein [Nocardioides daejeonensis]